MLGQSDSIKRWAFIGLLLAQPTLKKVFENFLTKMLPRQCREILEMKRNENIPIDRRRILYVSLFVCINAFICTFERVKRVRERGRESRGEGEKGERERENERERVGERELERKSEWWTRERESVCV
jgi:hypothetical protein